MREGGRAMKRLLFLGLGSALVFTMGGVGTAQADNGPHRSTAATTTSLVTVNSATGAGRCAGCHRAHTSQGEYNLKLAQPDLCFTCHGAGAPGSSTDVVNGTDGGSGALRGGGFTNAKMDAAAPTKQMTLDAVTGKLATSLQTIGALAAAIPTTSKHQIDGVTAGTAWGNGAIDATGANLGKTITLECGSCHDPHGNGNYRILRPVPVDSGVPNTADPVTGLLTVAPQGVKIPDATGTKVYTTTNYWLSGDSNVPLGGTTAIIGTASTTAAPDGYIQNVAAWCTTCHTRYLAGSGSYKTKSGDATFMYRHRSDANNKQGAANCITCHVSHGSNANMVDSAVVSLPGGGTAPVGDSRLLRVNNRAACLMCHNV